MAAEKEKSERKEGPAPAAAAAAAAGTPAPQQQPPQPQVSVSGAKVTYANFARATGTPEEVILDLALNPNAFNQVLDEPVAVDHRVVMSHATAKRLAMLLGEIIRRHEAAFGVIETDVRRRLRS